MLCSQLAATHFRASGPLTLPPLPAALRGLALRQLGRVLAGACLPSVAHEAAVLANAAAWADPPGARRRCRAVLGCFSIWPFAMAHARVSVAAWTAPAGAGSRYRASKGFERLEWRAPCLGTLI